MLISIAYDIPSDKEGLRRRAKLAKALEGYGERVQLSLFECLLTDKQLCHVVQVIQGLIDGQKDNIRIYNLCEKCRRDITIIGQGQPTSDPPEVIVI